MISRNVRVWVTCLFLAFGSWRVAAAGSGSTAFGGTAVALPGIIQAENFDEGGASVAYFDTSAGNRGGAYRQSDVDIEATSDAGGGWNIGWTRAGEWLQYTTSVTVSGTYSLELRVASQSTGGTVRLDVDGVDATGPIAVPNTGGWQTWTTIRKDGIVLAAGTRCLRLVFVTAGTDGIGNVNFLKLVAVPPSAPVVAAPSNGATSVAVTPALSWSASGATSYDVKFGTTSTPALAATDLTTARFTPAALANATTYYWQVVAKNAGGTTAGPVWSFTTVVAAPATPNLGAPADKASRVATNAALTWSATGATSYDVKLGTTPTPATAATGLTTASFTPTTLVPATTYYWQIAARNDGGVTAGPVWSFTTAAVPAPWSSQDIGAVGLAGTATYAAGAFTVAGAGADIWGTADAFQFVSQPVSGDIDFIARVASLTNTNAKAKAGLMLRESTAPDAAHVLIDVKPDGGGVEFLTRTANGALTTKQSNTAVAAPVYLRLTRIGNTVTGQLSTDGASWTTVGTATASAAWPLAGLVVNSRNIAALNTATFDTVTLSVPATTPTPPPPPASSATPGVSPVAYNAITDRTPRAKPALPQVGAAGFRFNDPTFGSKMMRVTDGSTRPGALNRSYRVSSNSHLAVWNANSTAFYVLSNDGTIIPYQFDPATMKASRFEASGSNDGGLTLRFYIEPHFSLIDPNLIYGAGGYNGRTILQYDFRTNAYTSVLDLDTVVGGLANTYVGLAATGGTTSENLLTFFGGPGQDSHYYVLWAPLNNLGARKVINTVNSTINGVSTNVPLNFHIHAASIDRSGRYVFIYPTSVDLAAPRRAAQVFLWDTATDLITPLPASTLSGGHDAAGFGIWINQDCCTATSWDAMQWQFRYLDAPTRTTDLIPQVLTPQEIYAADHSSWSNARPDALVPLISSTYRYGAGITGPWRPWDEEIIGVDLNGGLGGGPVYRFAHHRSDVRSDTDPASLYFWYEPIANVSPDGRWVIFTTNWEKTLGKDASEGTFRQDVFMVQLTAQ